MRNLIYRLYERSLERGLAPSDLPKHVAVMLDGNELSVHGECGVSADDESTVCDGKHIATAVIQVPKSLLSVPTLPTVTATEVTP